MEIRGAYTLENRGSVAIDKIHLATSSEVETGPVSFDRSADVVTAGPDVDKRYYCDWSAIDPSVFGTLFERGMDPGKRSQLGAHYTSREDIETLVEPVVVQPLRREWAEVRRVVETLLATGKKDPTEKDRGKLPEGGLQGPALRKARVESDLILRRFWERLEQATEQPLSA